MIPVKADMFRANGVWCVRLNDVPRGVAEEFVEDVHAFGGLYYGGGGGIVGSHVQTIEIRPPCTPANPPPVAHAAAIVEVVPTDTAALRKLMESEKRESRHFDVADAMHAVERWLGRA